MGEDEEGVVCRLWAGWLADSNGLWHFTAAGVIGTSVLWQSATFKGQRMIHSSTRAQQPSLRRLSCSRLRCTRLKASVSAHTHNDMSSHTVYVREEIWDFSISRSTTDIWASCVALRRFWEHAYHHESGAAQPRTQSPFFLVILTKIFLPISAVLIAISSDCGLVWTT